MSDVKFVAVVDDHTMVRKGLVELVNLFSKYKINF